MNPRFRAAVALLDSVATRLPPDQLAHHHTLASAGELVDTLTATLVRRYIEGRDEALAALTPAN